MADAFYAEDEAYGGFEVWAEIAGEIYAPIPWVA